ncbi:MAG TPA: DNA-binding response regulator [Clostridiales bacterium UBA8960]|nr:DNA-binding response regulator [Clostridiales bacterium UBA8960]
MMENKIKVLIADDHDLIRQGLKSILNYEDDFIVSGEAANGEEALALIHQYKPDILLMDINMPVKSGIEVLKIIKEKDINIKVLLLTVESDKKTILDAIEIGADGYILKGSGTQDIIDGIRRVFHGENYIDKSLVSMLFKKVATKDKDHDLLSTLNEKELEILYHLSKGYSNKEIGDMMYLSEKTIKNNATRIFKTIHVRDRVQATIYAIEHKIEELYIKP